MIFRNSLSFLVNLYVIAFHVSFHFLFIDTYISNIIGFCHLDISVPTAEYFGLYAKMQNLQTGQIRYRLNMLSLVL